VLGALDDAGEEVTGAIESVVGDDSVERLEPFAGLGYIDVGAVSVGRIDVHGSAV
jgi:hypothetical protein